MTNQGVSAIFNTGYIYPDKQEKELFSDTDFTLDVCCPATV